MRQGKIMQKAIRLVLIDDDNILRSRLQTLLKLVEGIEVVGNYATAEEALPHISKLTPDIVIMDDQMPGMNGIAATRRLKRNGTHCDADVIMLTESMDYLIAALEAGAAAYLPKNVKCSELIDIIRQVYQNKNRLDENSNVVNKVELTLSSIANADLILNFTNQVKRNLRASVIKTVGSSELGTAVTIGFKPIPMTNLMNELMNMPGVEKVEEPPMRYGFPGLFDKFGRLLKSKANTSKRIQVTLDETLMTRQYAAALN